MELARTCIAFDEFSGVLVCKLCSQTSFWTLNNLRSHAKDKHGFRGTIGKEFVNQVIVSSDMLRSMINADNGSQPVPRNDYCDSGAGKRLLLPLDRLPKCLDGAWITKGQELYWNAPSSLVDKNRRLKAVRNLPVSKVFQCVAPGCLYCCLSESFIRKHLRVAHNWTSQIPSAGSLYSTDIQRLSEGSASKYFPVTVPFIPGELPTTPSLNIPSPQRVHFSNPISCELRVQSGGTAQFSTPSAISVERDSVTSPLGEQSDRITDNRTPAKASEESSALRAPTRCSAESVGNETMEPIVPPTDCREKSVNIEQPTGIPSGFVEHEKCP